jgi:hypothetical protein
VTHRNEVASLKRTADAAAALLAAKMAEGTSMPKGATQRANRGGNSSGKGSRTVANDAPCGCCGKTNHVKADCFHRVKDCNLCGRTGHMAQVCRCPVQHVRGGNRSQQQRQQTQEPQPKGPATSHKDWVAAATWMDSWICPVCLAFNHDPTSNKCRIGCCHGKRPQPDKPLQPDAAGKSFIKLQLLQPSVPTETETCEEDAEMDDADAESERDKLQKYITDGQTMGFCVKQATAKLEELTPKLASAIDQAKAGKDIAGERLRLHKNQQTSTKDLTATITRNSAKIVAVQEQQVVLVAEANEAHAKRIEAIERDCARIIEENQTQTAEAQKKLKDLNERYERDFKQLDTAQGAAQRHEVVETKPHQAQVAVAPKPPTVTKENMQLLLGAAGSSEASPEQLALLVSMVPMLNTLLAAAMLPPPAVAEAPASNQAEEDAHAKEAEILAEQEKPLAAETKELNGDGAEATYKAGKPAKHSDRVNPMS